MATPDSLGDRIKGYESVPKLSLMKRTPVIIRIDGRAFHTYTKHITRNEPETPTTPFSQDMHRLMVHATEQLVTQIQGCVIGYTQSDEISLVLKDWTNLNTSSWFDNNLQKLCSVSASIATMEFNRAITTNVVSRPSLAQYNIATFDSRAFNVPFAEVCNYMIWRQQDASRNSVQMYARRYFSHKELHNKSNPEIMDMLMLQKGVNWNDLPVWCRRGTCVVRQPSGGDSERTTVVVDENIPIFTQDREYINNLLK